jgi:hypothetical protein
MKLRPNGDTAHSIAMKDGTRQNFDEQKNGPVAEATGL